MKIICIGRNYSEHAKELNNPLPEEPVIFMKPPSALLVNDKPLYYPEFTRSLHYEGEIVLKICRNGKYVQPEFAHKYYDRIAFGIDFTARDIQAKLKAKGLPWEKAKGFDGSAAISDFVSTDRFDLGNIHFQLHKNGQIVQNGQTIDMLFSFDTLIVHISRYFKLQVGDMIYTGTPAGVGEVQIGDTLEGFIEGKKMLECDIK